MATIRDELKKLYKKATGEDSKGANIAEVLAELTEAGVLGPESDGEGGSSSPK